MLRAGRYPEATVRLIDRSRTSGLDLDGTAERLDENGRRRLEAASPADATRFLIGRALLARTVAETLSVPVTAVTITARCPDCGLEHGRPQVSVGKRTVHASLSHTAELTAVAISIELPVGMDIERLDPVRFAGVEGVALSPVELQRWRRSPVGARLQVLASGWTTKEAVVKALGTGFRIDPATIDLPKTTSPGRATPIAGREFLVHRPDLAPDVVAAVALLLP